MEEIEGLEDAQSEYTPAHVDEQHETPALNIAQVKAPIQEQAQTHTEEVTEGKRRQQRRKRGGRKRAMHRLKFETPEPHSVPLPQWGCSEAPDAPAFFGEQKNWLGLMGRSIG